jgi:hypothetical protein
MVVAVCFGAALGKPEKLPLLLPIHREICTAHQVEVCRYTPMAAASFRRIRGYMDYSKSSKRRGSYADRQLTRLQCRSSAHQGEHYPIKQPSSSVRQKRFRANRLAIIKQSSMFVLSTRICAVSDLTYETK